MHDWAEFRHFLYLLKILERGGFRSAAEMLHTSQPNLTVQARQFQENASVTLYRKAKDGRIHPTESGLAFITLAKHVLEARDEAIEALIAIDRGELETIRFGCSPLVDQELFRTLCSLHKELLPNCTIRSAHGDTVYLAAQVLEGKLDAALITLPFTHPELRLDRLRKDKLVVCMRKDNPLAEHAALQVKDLQGKLGVFYEPDRHPQAHARLLELLAQSGVCIEEYSSGSHPIEMQMLVLEDYGLALVREGGVHEPELTTRRLIDVEWTIDSAIICRREKYPKTLPIIIRRLQKSILRNASPTEQKRLANFLHAREETSSPKPKVPIQLRLIR
ncbi:LysR substrate-binding domain-containing protein [Granulicella cerasi]|uniref:LysR substrate-binding domain-containing protein n=1 Tax=Granulicella cerasi TaxID=741063 RepID=A0ABW1ZC69_9BACT|nr:LysR family transcriptional regulator [Granulicella cerasi]